MAGQSAPIDVGMASPHEALPQPTIIPAMAHKMLLHSSYHAVHHHEDTLPHLSHGYGTLLIVLVLVHVVAISYWIYLLSRPGPPSRARPKRPSELKLVRCEDDWQVPSSARALPGRPNYF